MNNGQLEDLKQFIDSRVSQAEARLEEQIEGLKAEMHDGFAGVAEIVEELHKTNAEFDKRLAKLEQQTAA